MTPLRFRAWDKRRKEWYELPSWGSCEANGDSCKGVMELHNDEFFEWSMSTGLKDNKGKEIFEGDIVRDNEHHGTKHKVYWNDKECAWWVVRVGEPEYNISDYSLVDLVKSYSNENNLYKEDDCEIIGNIYQNPKLLK